jgi:hypothetical protein
MRSSAPNSTSNKNEISEESIADLEPATSIPAFTITIPEVARSFPEVARI